MAQIETQKIGMVSQHWIWREEIETELLDEFQGSVKLQVEDSEIGFNYNSAVAYYVFWQRAITVILLREFC